MSETSTVPASEDRREKSPLSYAGSAERIFGLRRRASSPAAKAAATVLAVLLVIPAWGVVTCRYLLSALWRGRQAELGAVSNEAALEAGRGPVPVPSGDHDRP